MEIEILQQTCGGTGFVARPHRLHLGAQNAEGVDKLHFILPDPWADCTLALYLRRRDGTQLAPIPLDAENCVTVDRRLTGSTGGQWMLAAVRDENYTAYTRPGSYEVYPTLPTDGSSDDLPPSLYEQFVARVLESARAAADSARKAETSAADTALQASLAQKAADQILADHVDAADCARRAEEAAKRAENIAPTEGVVSSVNGKGGVVQLTATDVGAVPRPAAPRPGEMVRILSVDADTGAVQTDTTAPATKEQLDAMTEAYAPLAPALLPYGVKKALTDAFAAGEWTAEDKLIALLQLSTDSYFYTKTAADKRFALHAATADTLGGVKVGSGLTVGTDGTLALPAATADTLGGVKVGSGLTVGTDGTLALPAATADTLGGVKVGSGLTVGTDGMLALTAADLNGVLGFTPARLPYTMVYDHSYEGTGSTGSASSPIRIPLAGAYDAIAMIRTETATYPADTEVLRQRVLLELVTSESSAGNFKRDYVALKGLPSTFTPCNSVNPGLIVMGGIWNSSVIMMRYKDRALELYWSGTGSSYSGELWNKKEYQYHVFGITLDSSILQVDTVIGTDPDKDHGKYPDTEQGEST